VLCSTVQPLVYSILFVTGERVWNVPESIATNLITEMICIDFVADAISENWQSISETLVAHLQTLLPEASPEFELSQLRVGAESQRWAISTSKLYKSNSQDQNIPRIVRFVIVEATEVSVKRNGKPYGAAIALSHITTHCKAIIYKDADTLSILEDFLIHNLPPIFLSPSSTSLAFVLKSLNDTLAFEKSWKLCLETVVESINTRVESLTTRELFKALTENSKELLTASRNEIQQLLLHNLELALQDKEPWDTIIEFIGVIDDESLDDSCFRYMTAALSQLSTRAKMAIGGFQQLFKNQPRKAQQWIFSKEGSTFVSNVLRLTEISDDQGLAKAAEDLNHIIDSTISSATNINNDSRVAVIHRELNTASVDSVLVNTLVQQAENILQNRSAEYLSALIPNTSIWESELLRFLLAPPKAAESVASPLKGAVFLYQDNIQTEHLEHIGRDDTGLSVPIRMAVYTTQLLRLFDPSLIKKEVISAVLKLLVKTTIIAEQKIGIVTANALWSPHIPAIELDMVEFISQSRKLVSSWLESSSNWWADETISSKFDFVRRATSEFYNSINDGTLSSYYSSLAYCWLTTELIETHGISNSRSEDVTKQLTALRRSKYLRSAVAYISSHKKILPSIPIASRWYNEMVSELTDINISELNDSVIGSLILFQNLITDQDRSFVDTAASQRLVFLVKRLMEALSGDSAAQYQVLSLSILNTLFSTLLTVYGEHWEVVISFIKRLWFQTQSLNLELNDPTLSLLYESLKLHSTLKNMAETEECNEDLQEALQDTEMERFSGLLNLLSLERTVPDEFHVPLRMVNMIISHELKTVPMDLVTEPEMLFHVLNSNSESLQMCGFWILHAKIPTLQQASSIETAFERTVARLPDELLSLLLEPPNMSDFEDVDIDEKLPLSLKGYLLSWILVFDHFENAVSAEREPDQLITDVISPTS
jgi:E3 ubiquitin-protein ligase listerin